MADGILCDDTGPSNITEVGVDASSKYLTGEHAPRHAICITQADFFQKSQVEGGAAGGQAVLEQDQERVVQYVGLLNSHSDPPYAVKHDYAKSMIFHGRFSSELRT